MQIGGCHWLGSGEWGETAKWINGWLWSDGNALELDTCGGCTTLLMYLMPLNCAV